MSQEFKEINTKHCFSCIQWDGQRTFYAEKKTIKVDVGNFGKCRITHQPIKGSGHCDQHFPLR